MVMSRFNNDISTSSPIDIDTLSIVAISNLIEIFKLSDGEEWIISAIPLTFETDDRFVVVIGIPKKEYFGDIDGAIRTGTTISIAIAFCGCVISVALFLIITQPLRAIGQKMEKVAQFDFSMLADGWFKEDNFFLEIRNLERNFNNMVKAFSGGIKVNKDLIKHLSYTTNSSTGNYSETGK
ncbi:hypothetical protein HK098_006401 [Nowakowskiella sp. JEL0407]|nr:hypothetical protein HK098_006401 [Nowakowskiella sp. JEL0407]